MLFPDIRTACTAAAVLREQTQVNAVELFDAAALRLATNKLLAIVSETRLAGDTGAALLIQCQGPSPEALTVGPPGLPGPAHRPCPQPLAPPACTSASLARVPPSPPRDDSLRSSLAFPPSGEPEVEVPQSPF